MVSELSQPFWSVGKLIFCVRLADLQSSCKIKLFFEDKNQSPTLTPLSSPSRLASAASALRLLLLLANPACDLPPPSPSLDPRRLSPTYPPSVKIYSLSMRPRHQVFLYLYHIYQMLATYLAKGAFLLLPRRLSGKIGGAIRIKFLLRRQLMVAHKGQLGGEDVVLEQINDCRYDSGAHFVTPVRFCVRRGFPSFCVCRPTDAFPPLSWQRDQSSACVVCSGTAGLRGTTRCGHCCPKQRRV